MVAAPGWLDALLARLDATGAAAVGGPIDPAGCSRPADRAVYLLRYVNYLRPLPDSAPAEPPGDNAIYRRDRLAGRGRRSIAGSGSPRSTAASAPGGALAMAEGAVVTFRGAPDRPRSASGSATAATTALRARYGCGPGAAGRGRDLAPVPLVMARRSGGVAGRGVTGRSAPSLSGLSVLLAWAARRALGGPAAAGLVAAGRGGAGAGRADDRSGRTGTARPPAVIVDQRSDYNVCSPKRTRAAQGQEVVS